MRVGLLSLQEAREDDVEQLLSFRNDPESNRFTTRTRVDPAAFRLGWLAVATSDTDFACVAKRDGVVVAMGLLELADGVGQLGMPKRTQAVLGYLVHPEHAGKGVATDLTRGLLRAAFDRLGLWRGTASCYAANTASVRVLEKVGMRREQHALKDSWHAELGWVDGYQYALLNQEWHAQHRSGPATD